MKRSESFKRSANRNLVWAVLFFLIALADAASLIFGFYNDFPIFWFSVSIGGNVILFYLSWLHFSTSLEQRDRSFQEWMKENGIRR